MFLYFLCRYYSDEWLNEDSHRLAPHQDTKLTQEKKKCFKVYFDDADVRRQVNIEFTNFSDGREDFGDVDSLRDRGKMDEKSWRIVHGVHAPILQKITLKLLAKHVLLVVRGIGVPPLYIL